MPEDLDPHFETVVREIIRGRVVPFLGAGVNLCGRAPDVAWQPGLTLPSGGELATHLAEEFGYPPTDLIDLVRVSQYVDLMAGSGPLYEELHRLFDADYPPTVLHEFLARLPRLLRERGYPSRCQLIVTTNYDDVLERAFVAESQTYDLVTYVAVGENRGKFLHIAPGGKAHPIERPNEYLEISPDEDDSLPRPVILKIHGAIDREDPERDSYVITEDHYIDYLTRTDISNLVPVTLARMLRRSNFLFLGYGLRDWNLRVILHRIWGEQRLSFASWAVQLRPNPFDEAFWQQKDVRILDVPLEIFVSELEERLQARGPPNGAR